MISNKQFTDLVNTNKRLTKALINFTNLDEHHSRKYNSSHVSWKLRKRYKLLIDHSIKLHKSFDNIK